MNDFEAQGREIANGGRTVMSHTLSLSFISSGDPPEKRGMMTILRRNILEMKMVVCPLTKFDKSSNCVATNPEGARGRLWYFDIGASEGLRRAPGRF